TIRPFSTWTCSEHMSGQSWAHTVRMVSMGGSSAVVGSMRSRVAARKSQFGSDDKASSATVRLTGCDCLKTFPPILSVGSSWDREGEGGVSDDTVHLSGWTLDPTARRLMCEAGQQARLTQAEYRILALLVRHPGQVITRDQLTEAVAGRPWQKDDRSVD